MLGEVLVVGFNYYHRNVDINVYFSCLLYSMRESIIPS